MNKKKIADMIFKILRNRQYYEINNFDIEAIEENKTLLVEKYIMDHSLYLRVEIIRSKLIKHYYEWKMRPISKFIVQVSDFDIHTLPAGKILLKKVNGLIMIRS